MIHFFGTGAVPHCNSAMMREGRTEGRAATAPTEVFGSYLVYERLGIGGMAEVYRAKKQCIEGFQRPVALKRLLPHLAADEEFVRSFVREARLASYLHHVNIAQTYDLGRVDGTYFIAMELVDGADLRQIIRHTAYSTGPMPVPLALCVLVQLAEALDYAHTLTDESGGALGLIHRDISPSNAIVDRDGTVKLIDFGIARASTGSLHTKSGRLKGKFCYLAPEVLEGQIDHRIDLWSLGVVMWELLTARPLFHGGDDFTVLDKVRRQPIPPASSLNRHVPKDLEMIVATALARNPRQRWQSAAHLRSALASVARRPGMNASTQDLARWIAWAFTQPASERRWDERTPTSPGTSSAAGAPVEPAPSMGAADDPSIVIDIETLSAAAASQADIMVPVDTVPTVSMRSAGGQGPASPVKLVAAATADPIFRAPSTASRPTIPMRPASGSRPPPTAPDPFDATPNRSARVTARWPAQTRPPARGTSPPPFGDDDDDFGELEDEAALLASIDVPTERPDMVRDTLADGTPTPFDTPEFRAAVAAYQSRAAERAAAEQPQTEKLSPRDAAGAHPATASGVTEPVPPRETPAPTGRGRLLGGLLIGVMCSGAAVGGYWLMHWLSTR